MVNIEILITTFLCGILWFFTRYRHTNPVIPRSISLDIVFEELATSFGISIICVFVLVPSLGFLLFDTIPAWASLRWLKFAAVLGTSGIIIEFYGRLVENISSS